MRIISKFHDYYDTAMGMGIDPNLIYRREIRMNELADWRFEQKVKQFFEIPEAGMFRLEQPLALIGFCGKMYPYWLDVDFVPTLESVASQARQNVWISDDDMIRQHLSSQRPSKQDIDESVAKDIAGEVRAFQGFELDRASFREFDCPAFLLIREAWPKKYRVFTNPRLANFDFARHFDAYTAFQEISMFLGSQLAPEDHAPRTTGDDKTIAVSKGFDEQSFRTQAPGQKKLNRQANKQRKHPGSQE